MRDILTIPIHAEDSLIIACDNSGGIGMKEQDFVQVPYETVTYYSFRVAVMECMAAGGQPLSVVLNNFCGNEPWEELLQGVKKGANELGLKDISITGSTESNFMMLQSAVGLMVLGRKGLNKKSELLFSSNWTFAVIGLPLVGPEVMAQNDEIVPLSVFQEINQLNEVLIWSVGSKGILSELNQIFINKQFTAEKIVTNVDLLKSSGPATCFIVVYDADHDEQVRRIAGDYFHSLKIK
ncbi:ATP-binding protein [Neobacillus sp. MM2021_6]|uniref:ATP-binding protein n=1 Tax=Bacillaceae TaxID=186817 RepID=UPI001409FF8E|nr:MULTISPECIES: ATP-binding protein [Bacillaceae]MBO0961843.1 ATP-binding protein [Neobacillus sp. MM2021_6]NHC20264.1 ATP-binding protein [Bacillus sp. MM2020_4]